MERRPRGPPGRHQELSFAPVSNFFGVVDSSSALTPCTGVDASFDVQPVAVPSNESLVAYWCAVLSAANIWAQTGYFVSNQAPQFIQWFAQVWDLRTLPGNILETYNNSTILTTGIHDFRIFANGNGTRWSITLDGNVMASTDLLSAVSASTSPQVPILQTLMEMQDSAWMETVPVKFTSVLNTLKNGVWVSPTSENLYVELHNPPVGLPAAQGRVQNSSLLNNQMILGGSGPVAVANEALWTGGRVGTNLQVTVSPS